MKKSVFISDLHLSPDTSDLVRAFQAFLQGLSGVDELFILGDLFEIWLGDDDQSDFANQIRHCLANLQSRGIRLRIQRGNRDFLLGNRFAREIGAEMIGDTYLYTNDHRQALLMHGDLLCTDDRAYQRFRRKVQNPVFNFVLRNLPLSQRRRIAANWRARSRALNHLKPENIMDVNIEAVHDCFRSHEINTLLHGHTHRPGIHQLADDKHRIVLGDWSTNIWWVETTASGFDLYSRPLSKVLSEAS